MIEREGANRQVLIFKDYLRRAGSDFMKVQIEVESSLRIAQLERDDFGKTWWSIQLEVCLPTVKMHRREEAHKPIVVIAVQMADHNMVDLIDPYTIFFGLNLRSFTTINQKGLILNSDNL